MYRRIGGKKDAMHLQEDLNRLPEWEKTWLMDLHPNKCTILRITNEVKPNNSALYFHDHILSLAIDYNPKSKYYIRYYSVWGMLVY